VQKDVYFGLQQGTSVLKQIQREMGGIENVEKLIGEGAEQKAFQEEVAEMLNGRMTNQEEDEVEEELAAMEAEANKAAKSEVKLPTAPSEIRETPVLPDAPVDVPAGAESARREKHEAEPLAA